jgi:membrane complex biogenesis BtpA family protein
VSVVWDRPLVGMVHLGPLPGAPNYDGAAIADLIERAAHDAQLLVDGGFDAILLQNANDHPPARVVPAPSVAAYACIARQIRDLTDLPLGLSVLKSDVSATFGIAAAAGANFVRLKCYVGSEIGPEGVLEGCAAEAVRTRRMMGLSGVEIWADALQPTSRQVSPVSPLDLVRWSFEFGEADRVIVTGDSLAQSWEILHDVRPAVDGPLILGGGVGPSELSDALSDWDGVIVGRYLRDGDLRRPISAERVAEIRDARPAAHPASG